MNADGTLTPRELEKLAPSGQSRVFRDAAGLPRGEIEVGDRVRVVAYTSPTFLDSWLDSPQENAEERTEEILAQFTAQGITVILSQVVGVTVADTGIDSRECYVYDLEVVGLTAPPEGLMLAAFDWRGFALALGAATALTVSVLVVKVEFFGAGDGVKVVSNGIFWISLAAIAVSVAVIVKSAKVASP